MTPAPPSRPAGVMAGFTKVGGLRPPQSGGVVGAEVAAAWASRRPGLARAADLAGSAARPNEVDGAPTPGLRGTPVALRSEPGIISARTLRGSEGVNTIRREQGGTAGDTGVRQPSPSGGERREKSRGACGEALTGVRSERGRRDAIASRWPREAETPEGGECVPRRAASPGGCVAVQMASAQAKHWRWGYRQRRQALRRESAASSIIKLMLRVA